MKIKYVFLSSIVLLSSLINSCGVCSLDFYVQKEPIYLPLENISKDIKFTSVRKFNDLGKIYTYKDYIFINENNFGVHVIDNKNPKNPEKIGFIKIPFNEDIAIKNNILYADILNEIVSIDISNIKNVKVIERIKLDDYNYNSLKFNINPSKGILIGNKRIKKYSRDCQNNFINIFGMMPSTTSNPIPQSADISNSTGKGGSLARFALVNDYLYTVSTSNLNLFDTKDPNKIITYGSVSIDNGRRDIETIFAYKDKLFMGSRTGAYIYDNSNPQQPTFITKVEHTRSCDPVVVENDKAYVTLKGDNTCRGGNNQLDIIDLSDIKNSKIIKSYNMDNPSGLAIKDNNLFICDLNKLKIFDVKDSMNIKEISSILINRPNDIILNENNQGVIVSKEGLYQYDFSGLPDKKDFQKLSFIPTEKDKYFNGDVEFIYSGDNEYY
ncbi:MAG: hypothetical protein U0354_16045, partial [Candidatus Sericytochromatia bacterium]